MDWSLFFAIAGWAGLLYLAFAISYPWMSRWVKSLWSKLWGWIATNILNGLMGGDKR